MRPVPFDDDARSPPLDYASPPRRSPSGLSRLASGAVKRLRPLSITGATVLLVAAWFWLDDCNTQYRAGDAGGGRTTAGWFILGLPFLLGFVLLASLLFSFIARRAGVISGWACLLVLFIPLMVRAYVSSTPAARLRSALNIDLPAGTRIQRLDQFDSFNDGISISGVCSATPQVVQTLIAAHALKTQNSGMLRQVMRDEPIPEDVPVLASDELTIYYDANTSLLYFYRRLRPLPRS